MEYNLADLFESVVDVVPERAALAYLDIAGTGEERRLSYAELDAEANRTGSAPPTRATKSCVGRDQLPPNTRSKPSTTSQSAPWPIG